MGFPITGGYLFINRKKDSFDVPQILCDIKQLKMLKYLHISFNPVSATNIIPH